MAKVVVKVFNEEGKWLLNEIRGLKEGTIIEGKWDRNNHGFDFKWNGNDAVLWLGINCRKFVPKRRLEKGYILSPMCWAVTPFKHEFLECGSSKNDVISSMNERGWKRSEYEIIWVVRGYNAKRDVETSEEGVGDTKNEAINNFFENYVA